MVDVANLQVVISADTSAAERGIESLDTKVGGIGGSIATAFGGAAIAGIAALGAALTASVVDATGFEKEISAVGAVSGASADQMKQLSDLALQLGKDTSFSASESAKGIEELVKAGVSISDVMGGAAKASLDLAAAGGVSVGEAAEIASNAMNVFNLKGADMAHVADQIAGAANASAIDVNDYKFALASSGAVAATVGVSFEDLSTAIAVMGQAGIKGSDAGTSLKTMLLNLTPTTDKQIALARELGIVTADGANKFFDASGKAKSMADIAGVLQQATAGLTEQQRLQALQTLFGTDAIRAAAIMAKNGSAGFEEMAASIGKISAADVANTRLDNLAGSIEKFKGSAETAAITFGMALLPVLRQLTDWGTDAVNGMIPNLDAVGKGFADMVDAMTGDEEKAIAGFARLSDGLSAALGPDLAGKILDTMVDIRDTVEITVMAINATFNANGTEMSTAWNNTWGQILRDTLFQTQQLLATIRIVAFAMKGDWQSVWEEMTLMTDRNSQRQAEIAQQRADMMLATIDHFTDGGLTKLNSWLDQSGAAARQAWDQMVDTVTSAGGRIVDAVSSSWSSIVETVTTGTANALSPIVDTWNQAQQVTETVYRAIQNVLIGVWDAIYASVIKPKVDAIEGYLSEKWEAIRAAIETKVNAARDVIGLAWDAVSSKATEELNAVLTFVRDTIFEPIRAAVESKINAARDLFGQAVQAVSDKAHAILDPVLKWWSDTIWEPIRAAVDTAVYGPKGAHTQFESAVSAISGIVNGALQGVKSVWEGTWTAIQRAAESPQEAMRVLTEMVGKLKDIMPAWLIPHSPTPFQIGLEGIMRAAQKLDGAFGNMSGVDGWLKAAMSYTHVPENWLGPLEWIVQHESTGDPHAKNPNSTASGLFQMIDSTWAASRDKGLPDDIWDPVINAIAGIRYIISRYGDPFNAVEFWQAHNHYAEGGWAGLHGPELAMLGERGPEYVIPHSQLGGGGGGAPMQTLRVDVAIGGRVAEQIYVTGREIAIRRGRVPVGST